MNKKDRVSAMRIFLLSLNNELARTELEDQEKKNTYANAVTLMRDCLKSKYEASFMQLVRDINKQNKAAVQDKSE